MINKCSLKDLGYSTFNSDVTESSLALAARLGSVYEETSIPLVQTLTPRKKNEVKNTYSGIFGTGIFPMHTDLAHWFMPPRYILIRYVTPSPNVSTNILDSKLVIESESASCISRSHFKPRKHLNFKTNILKVFHNQIFRWDSVFMVPVNNRAQELQSRILTRIKKAKYEELFFDTAGDCLLVDNWRLMHGRGQVPSGSLNRKIERIYLNEINYE